MSKSITEDKIEHNPVCELRAESEITNQFEIIDYDLYSIDFEFLNENIDLDDICLKNNDTFIELAKENALGVVFMTISVPGKDNTYLVNITDKLIEYITQEYDASTVDEIINLKIDFKFESDNKIIVDDDIPCKIHPVSTEKIILHDEYCKQYPELNIINKNNKLDDFKDNFTNIYYTNKYAGTGIIKNYKNTEEDNTIVYVETDNGETIEFVLEYPDIYDEDNPVIEFVNTVGGGSVMGLENSTVELVPKSKANNPPAVNNYIALKNEQNDTSESNNVSYNNQSRHLNEIYSTVIQWFGLTCMFLAILYLFLGQLQLSIIFAMGFYISGFIFEIF